MHGEGAWTHRLSENNVGVRSITLRQTHNLCVSKRPLTSVYRLMGRRAHSLPPVREDSRMAQVALPASAGGAKRRKRGLWSEIVKNRWAYVFISPFYILF